MAQAGGDQRIGDIVESVGTDQREPTQRNCFRRSHSGDGSPPFRAARAGRIDGSAAKPQQCRLVGYRIAELTHLCAEIRRWRHEPGQMHALVPFPLVYGFSPA